MKKRLFSLLLAVALLVGMLPILPVYAEEGEKFIYVGGVEMKNNTYLANGASSTDTTKPSGGYAHYADGVLTLCDYVYEGSEKCYRN